MKKIYCVPRAKDELEETDWKQENLLGGCCNSERVEEVETMRTEKKEGGTGIMREEYQGPIYVKGEHLRRHQKRQQDCKCAEQRVL